MEVEIIYKKRKINQKHQDKLKDSGYANKRQEGTAFEDEADNNLCVKGSMVAELVEMGISLDAIERILNLKPEVLDRLL